MKYLEQRVEELELEVKLLKAKNKLEETKKHDYLFSHSDQEFINQEFIKKFGLETTFASPYDSSDIMEHSLDTITLSSISEYNITNYINSHDITEYPPYPNIISSWDDFDKNTMKDWVEFNHTDKIPPYPRHDEISLNNLNSTEKKIEKEFGKIVSKFKILTHEWEMDGYGYVINDKNDKRIIVTNHGKPMIVDRNYLNDIISGYKERIQETQRALFLIKTAEKSR
jgi:hypothetical protein